MYPYLMEIIPGTLTVTFSISVIPFSWELYIHVTLLLRGWSKFFINKNMCAFSESELKMSGSSQAYTSKSAIIAVLCCMPI